MRRIGFLVSLLFLATGLFAQSGISTDRPTQTVGASLVPIGTFQIESGYQYAADKNIFFTNGQPRDDGRKEYLTINTSLIRFGVANWLELRVSQGLNKTRDKLRGGQVVFETNTEFSPSSIGVKIHILQGEGASPQISLFGELGGDVLSEFRERTAYSDIRVNFEQQIGDLTLAYNLGWQVKQGLTARNFFYSFVMSWPLAENASLFIEPSGSLTKSLSPDHQILAGLTYQIKSNSQVDLYGGRSLSSNGLHTILGFGFSFRFPRK